MEVKLSIAQIDLIVECLNAMKTHHLGSLIAGSRLHCYAADIDDTLQTLEPVYLNDNDVTIVYKRHVYTYEYRSTMTNVTHIFYSKYKLRLIENIQECDKLFTLPSNQLADHLKYLELLDIYYTNTELLERAEFANFDDTYERENILHCEGRV